MAFKIELSQKAKRQIKKIDPAQATRILDFLQNRLALMDDPADLGKQLKGTLADYWCYRVGDWRLLCSVSGKVLVLVVTIGHRREIYKV